MRPVGPVRTCSYSRRIVFSTAATIILTLLLCPAVTRVLRMQPLVGHSTTYTPSFQKSLDVPPDPHVLLPDVTAVPVILANVTQPSAVRWLRPTDDVLPWCFLGSSTRPLRAPPVRLS
jgi:hypothetical protein